MDPLHLPWYPLSQKILGLFNVDPGHPKNQSQNSVHGSEMAKSSRKDSPNPIHPLLLPHLFQLYGPCSQKRHEQHMQRNRKILVAGRKGPDKKIPPGKLGHGQKR